MIAFEELGWSDGSGSQFYRVTQDSLTIGAILATPVVVDALRSALAPPSGEPFMRALGADAEEAV